MKNRQEQIKDVLQHTKEQMCIIFSDNPEAWKTGTLLTEQEAENEKKKGTMLLNIDTGQTQAVLIKLKDFSVRYLYHEKHAQ